MDNPKTTQAHNTSLTGAVDFQYRMPEANKYQMMSQDAARVFVGKFKTDNPDVHLSDAQWTKFIDALSNG